VEGEGEAEAESGRAKRMRSGEGEEGGERAETGAEGAAEQAGGNWARC
jgi:hypothetical protein